MKDSIYVVKSMFLKPKIYFVSFWVGQKCSLKCRLYCNLIPSGEQISASELKNAK